MLKPVSLIVRGLNILRRIANRVFFAVWGIVATTSVFLYTRAYARSVRAYRWTSGKRRLLIGVTATVVLLVGLAVNFSAYQPARAAVSDNLNFQARLEKANGAIANDGNYNIRFRLYNASTGGSALWTESYLNSASQGVRVVNGYVSVNLGSVTAFPGNISWDQDMYITMEVGGTSTGTPTWDGEMSPRLKLTAVPYAFQAKSATQLQASDSGNVATLSFTTPTQNNSIILPNASGTVCLQSSSSCGFAVSSGATGYIWNGTAQQTANFNIISANAASVTALIQGASGQTANIFEVRDVSGNLSLGVNQFGNAFAGPLSSVGGRLGVSTGSATARGVVIQGMSGQTGSLFQLQDSGSNVNASFNGTGAQLTLGRVSGTTGQLVLNNSSGAGGITLQGTATAGSYVLNLPAENGTLCSTGSICAGYAAAPSSGNFVELAPTVPQTDSSTNASLAINKTGASGNLLTLQNNGVNVATVGNTGNTLFQNSTNSTAAFQIQNAAGQSIINVDTSTTPNLITNGSFEPGSTGWASKGGSSIAQNGSNSYVGSSSLAISTSAANQGAGYNVTLSPNTTYALSFWARQASGSTTATIGRQDNGSDVDCTAQLLDVQWRPLTCSFTTGATVASPNIYIKQTDAVARTIFIDAVQIQLGTTVTQYQDGLIQLNGIINSPLIVRPAQSSSRIVDVQNGAGTSLLNVDGAANAVGIGGTLLLQAGTSSGRIAKVMTSSSSLNANDVIIMDSSGRVAATTTARDPRIFGVTQYAASSNSGVYASIHGAATVNATTNGGANPISIGDQLVTSNLAGYVMVDNNATAGILGYATSALASGNGTVTAFIKPVSGQSTPVFRSAADSTTAFQIQNAAGTALFNANTTSGQIDVTGTLNVTGTLGSISTSSGGNNLNFSRNGINYVTATNAAGSLYLGAGGNSGALRIAPNGSIIAQNATDSTTAFQIQNAAGTSNLLVADTVNNKLGVGMLPNSGLSWTLQVNSGGIYSAGQVFAESGVYSNTAFILNGTQTDSGYIMKRTIAGDTVSANDVVVMNASAQTVATSTARDTRVYGVVGSAATAGNQTPVAIAGNTLVNADASYGAIAIGDQLVTSPTSGRVMKDNNATTGILGYATSALASGTGTVGVRLQVVNGQSSPVFRNATDSTTAFQIQNSSGTGLFVADTTNGMIGVGGAPTLRGDGTKLEVLGAIRGTNLFLSGTLNNAGAIYKGGTATGSIAANDVVIFNSSSGSIQLLSTTTTSRDNRIFGVAFAGAADGEGLQVAIAGNATVNVDTGAVAVGDQLVTSSTAGRATVDNNATTGILGYATTSKAAGSNGTVGVRLQIQTGQYSPTFRNATDSTTAFRVQNAAGTNTLVIDTTNQRLAVGPAAVPANGVLTVGTNTTTAAGGLYFGTDTNLYRSTANTLKTDSVFVGNSGIFVNNTTGTAVAGLTSTGVLEFGSGLAARDTNLYRYASGSLQTDGGLRVGSTLRVQNGVGFGGDNQSGNQLTVFSTTAANRGIVIRGAASQTGDLLQLQNNSANLLTAFDSSGRLQFADGAGSAYDTNLYRSAAGVLRTDGKLNIGTATTASGAQLVVSTGATNGTGLVVQAVSGQTADIAAFQSSNGQNRVRIDGIGDLYAQGVRISNGANNTSPGLQVTNALSTTVAAFIQGSSGQTADLLRLQDSGGNIHARFSSDGSQLTLGRAATTGTVSQGKLVLSDGTASGYQLTLQAGTLDANQTIVIPTTVGASDQVCLQSLANCTGTGGGIAGSGTQNYIAKFDTAGGNHVGNSIIYDDGSSVSLNTNSTTAFKVEQTGVNNNTLVVDTTNGKLGIGQAPLSGGKALQVAGGASINGNTDITGTLNTTSVIYANKGVNINNASLGDNQANISKNYTLTGTVNIGDVVILDGSALASTTTIARDARILGVATYSASYAVVAISGVATVNADTAAVAVGDQLVTSTTAGHVTVDNNATTGILGYATTSKAAGSNGTVGVRLQIQTGQYSPTFRNATDSTSAFRVQNAAGTNLLSVDTLNSNVVANGVCVASWGGVGIGTGCNNSAKLSVATAAVGAQINVVGSTQDILQLQDEGVNVFTVGDGGATLLKNSADSTAALRIQNAAGTNLLVVDTTNQRLAVGPAAVPANGVLTVGTNTTTTAGGVYFGTDTVLYRNGTSSLRTSGNLSVDGNLTLVSCDTITAKFCVNTSGTGANINVSGANDILNLRTGSTLVTQVTSTGSTLFRNASNSSSGFTVQNASSASLLNINTSNGTTSISGTRSAEVGSWTTGPNLPAVREEHTGVYSNGYLYVLGGSGSYPAASPMNSVAYSALSSSNGSMGSWASTTNLPAALFEGAAANYNGYIYYTGGQDGTNTASTVYYAKQNANGTLGSWATANALPAARREHTATVINGYLYVVGGHNTSGVAQSTVYYAKINSDGSLGSWATGTAMPGARNYHAAATANGYLYIVGGQNGANVATVLYAKPDASTGAISAWTTSANPLPVAYRLGWAATANNYLYYIGGYDGAGSALIRYASLNALTGANGSWTTNATNRPTTNWFNNVVAANGYFYETGGGFAINTTRYAALTSLTSNNVIELQTNGSNVASVNGSGHVVIQNSMDATNSFQIQNASGQSLFVADTFNQRLAVGPGAVPATSVLTVGSNTSTADGGITFGTDTSLYRFGSNVLGTDSRLLINAATGGAFGLSVRTTGDSNDRLQVLGNGTIQFGSGSGLADTTLYRSAANTLKTDDNFTIQTASDSATAFQVQDAAGTAALSVDTTALTTAVQAKYDSVSTGSNLITTTDFTNPAWTSTGWNTTTTTATHNTGNTSALTTNQVTPVNGTTYQISYTVSGSPATGSTLTTSFGGITVATHTFATTASSTGFTETRIITASGSGNLSFTPSTSFNGIISAVEVRVVSQQPTAALVVKNASGVANLEVRTSSSVSNTLIGLNSGSAISSGVQNTAVGSSALQQNTSGSDNAALGYQALQANSTGANNTALGSRALQANTVGRGNTAVGHLVLGNNLTGNYNSALGVNALAANVSGAFNTAIGSSALQATLNSINNVAVGSNALNSLSSGGNNTALGVNTLTGLSLGSNNIAIGFNSGSNVGTGNQLSTGSHNTFIGYYSGLTNSTQVSRSAAIGTHAQVGSSDSIILGCVSGINSCTNTTTVGIGTQYAPNALTVSPGTYSTGTISQSGTAITGSGTTFTAAMSGGTIYYSDGTTAVISAYNSATSLTVSVSKTVAAGASYVIVYGGFNVTGSGTAYLQPTTDTVNAFRILAANGNPILTADSTNQTIGLGAAASSDAKLYVSTGLVGMRVNQIGSGNLLELQVAGTNVATVNATGAAVFKNSTNSTAALQVQNSSGTPLFTVDTSTTANLLSNPSIEQNTIGWAAKGSASIARDTSLYYTGYASLAITTTAASNDGARLNYTLSPNTTYSLSFYIRTSGATVQTVSAGRQDNGSDIDCTTGQQMDASVWRRYSCAFTTGSTISGSNIYIKQSDAVARTIYVDSVQLQTGSTTTRYQEGTIQLGGVIDSPAIFKAQSNAVDAFQIQNASGQSLFQVDSGNNLIYTSGILQIGTLAKTYTTGSTGLAAGDVAILADESGSAKAISTTTPRDPRVLGVARFTVGSGSGATIQMSGSASVNADATYGAINVGDQLVTSPTAGRVMADNNATTGILGIATSALASGTGSITVNLTPHGGQSTPKFQNSVDSTTAFRIQNAAGSNLFVADTTNSRLAVGPSAVPANGTLTVGTNTTTAAGGIYFGTDVNLYRVNGSQLRTDSQFYAGGGLFYSGSSGYVGTLGSSGNTNAAIFQSGGSTSAGNTGVVTVQSGANTGTGNTGNVVIQSGAASAGNSGSIIVDVGTASGTAGTVSLGTTNASSITIGRSGITTTIAGSLTSTGTALFQNSSDSTTAFQIQNSAGTSNLFVADTTNSRVGIGKAPAQGALDVNGSIYASGSLVADGIGGCSLSYKLCVQTAGAGAKINVTASSNILELENNGTDVITVGSTGSTIFRNSTNSTTALQVQDAAGTNLFAVDTTNGRAAIGASAVPANAALTIGTNTTTADGGMYFGTDTSLYRAGTGVLRTGGSFASSSVMWANYLTANQVALGYINGSTNGPGITFSSAMDTNLYRSAAGVLKTDSSFQVAGTGTSYVMGPLGLGTTNPQAASAMTIANGSWMTAVDSTGSGYVNMFKVNANNEIQVGAAMNVDGGIVLPTNGGQLTLVDMPIDATATASTPQSYSFRVGSTNALTVYGQADGSGNAQNLRVAVGSSISPQYTLDVGGDINTSTMYRVSGVQIASTNLSDGSNLAKLNGTQTFTGVNTLQNTSTTAFRIQNTGGSTTLFVADTTNSRIAVGPAAVAANAVLTVGTNTTTASGGIYFGTDTALYRSAANTLTTPGALTVVGALQADSLTLTGSCCGTGINFNNENMVGLNTIQISDSGAGEGFSWADATWSIDNSDLARSNTAGNLNLYGTTGNVAIWRPALFVQNATSYATATAGANGSLAFTSSGTGGVSFRNGSDSTTALQIQNAAGTGLFTADASNLLIKIGTGTPTLPSTGQGDLFVTGSLEVLGAVLIGTSSNGAMFDGTTHELVFTGTARHARTVTLAPSYAGSAIRGDGSNNTGTMSTSFCSGSSKLNIPASGNPCGANDQRTYYEWTANATNDNDIWVTYKLPTDFSAFDTNAFTFHGWGSTSSETAILTVYNGSTSCGTFTLTGDGSWQSNNITASTINSNCAGLAAGDVLTIDVKLTVGTNGNFARAGEILVNYLSRY